MIDGMTDREGLALLDNVRYVHGRDTCDEAGRPLTTYLCPYHEGYEAALDLSWKDRRAEEISIALAVAYDALRSIVRLAEENEGEYQMNAVFHAAVEYAARALDGRVTP